MSLRPLQIDGFKEKVLAEIVDKKIWFKIGDETYSYDLLDLLQSQHGKSGAFTKSPDRILAPMPGKMTKIFVKSGQSVKKGDSLVVMEAMKMEYTLKSDVDAEVLEIKADLGQQVTLGQLLVQLKV